MVGTGAAKVAEQIKHVVTETLARRIQDPRLGFLTVTEVRLSRDWSQAEVFYTVFGDDQARADTAEGLAAAKGQLRTAVARNLKMRSTPALVFVLDQLPVTSGHFEELLASVRASDAAIAASAAQAEYAGEADPYKHDDAEDDPDEAAL